MTRLAFSSASARRAWRTVGVICQETPNASSSQPHWPVGWRAPVYAAATLAIIFGVASLAFPGAEQGSNLGTIAALTVLGWAIAFLALAEYVDRDDEDQSSRQRGEPA